MAKNDRVVLFALIKDNKILLEKRSVKKFTNLQYLIPGGAINKNEKLNDALKREMMEELRIIPTDFKLLTDEDIPGLYGNMLKPFIVTSWQGEIPKFILDKKDSFPLEWMEIDKALEIPPIKPTKKIIKLLKNYLSKT